MPIVVVGNVFVDFKGFPEGTYLPAGRNAGRVEIVHGGVGRNVAEDIANVGLPTRFVGSTPSMCRWSRTAWASGLP